MRGAASGPERAQGHARGPAEREISAREWSG